MGQKLNTATVASTLFHSYLNRIYQLKGEYEPTNTYVFKHTIANSVELT